MLPISPLPLNASTATLLLQQIQCWLGVLDIEPAGFFNISKQDFRRIADSAFRKVGRLHHPDQAREHADSAKFNKSREILDKMRKAYETYRGWTSISSLYQNEIDVHGTSQDGKKPPFIVRIVFAYGAFRLHSLRRDVRWERLCRDYPIKTKILKAILFPLKVIKYVFIGIAILLGFLVCCIPAIICCCVATRFMAKAKEAGLNAQQSYRGQHFSGESAAHFSQPRPFTTSTT